MYHFFYTMFLIPFDSTHLFYNADLKTCQSMKLVFFDASMEVVSCSK